MIYKVLPNEEVLTNAELCTTAYRQGRRIQTANRRLLSWRLRFLWTILPTNPGMLPTLRTYACLLLLLTVPGALLGQGLPEHAGGAILHSDGGVWVNGYEAHDSTAVFAGDLVETKPGFSAHLSLDGSTILLAPETVGKFQNDFFELDHGVVSVVTSKTFKVHVNCIRVIPVANEWTEYIVSDLSGTAQVNARKKDLNVEHEQKLGKPAAGNEASEHASVHEGEEKDYEETEICGAPPSPTSPTSGISPKWIAAGAAGGGGLLLCLVIHCFGGGGGSKNPEISPSSP
jgi:hypothetical protein